MLLCAHHQATRCCRLHNQAGVGMESTHKSRSGGGGVVRRLLRLAVAEHGAAAVARHGDDDRISREGRKGSRASALRGVACIHPRGAACIPPGVLHASLQGCCMHPSRGAACTPPGVLHASLRRCNTFFVTLISILIFFSCLSARLG